MIWIALTVVNKVNAAAEQAATAISAFISVFTTILVGKRMWYVVAQTNDIEPTANAGSTGMSVV